MKKKQEKKTRERKGVELKREIEHEKGRLKENEALSNKLKESGKKNEVLERFLQVVKGKQPLSINFFEWSELESEFVISKC